MTLRRASVRAALSGDEPGRTLTLSRQTSLPLFLLVLAATALVPALLSAGALRAAIAVQSGVPARGLARLALVFADRPWTAQRSRRSCRSAWLRARGGGRGAGGTWRSTVLAARSRRDGPSS